MSKQLQKEQQQTPFWDGKSESIIVTMNYVKCSFSTITENEKFPTNKRKKNSNPCTEKKKEK